MKTYRIVASLILLGGLAFGEVTIVEQIAAIQVATDEDRVELVNEFKVTLSTLSDEERSSAIDQLRSTMQVDAQQSMTQTKTQTRERSRVNQMSESQDIQAAQQLSQQQAGSQGMRQGSIGTGAGSETGTGNHFMGRH